MKDFVIRYWKELHIKEIHIAAETKGIARKILNQREPTHGNIIQIKELKEGK